MAQQQREVQEHLHAAAGEEEEPAHSSPQPIFPRAPDHTDHLTLDQRSAIVSLWRAQTPKAEIARLIPCHLNSVLHWIAAWEHEGSVHDAPHSGRPRLTSSETDQQIEQLARKVKFTTPREVNAELKLDVSARTTRRRLDEVGLFGRVAETEYVLNEQTILKRLSFAQGYADWSVDQWGRVLFSDETYFPLFGNSQVWVQRPVGAAFDPQYIANFQPHSEKVSLWGCFCCSGVGQAELFTGTFDAPSYRDILQGNLLPTARHFYPQGQWWFQQDNALQHTSILARHWFHNHGVSLLDFPPFSPDLNPIENLWGILKARVERRHARTLPDLERVIQEEWEGLDSSLLSSLVASMPKRCQAVIASRGHKTCY